jgi:hypothetical protein
VPALRVPAPAAAAAAAALPSQPLCKAWSGVRVPPWMPPLQRLQQLCQMAATTGPPAAAAAPAAWPTAAACRTPLALQTWRWYLLALLPPQALQPLLPWSPVELPPQQTAG